MTDFDLFINAVEEKPAKRQRRINENSVNAFYSKDVQLKRGTQKERIFSALKKLGKATQRELSEETNIPRHLVPDRCLQLLGMRKIKKMGKVVDPITNKEVDFYAVA